MNSIRELQKVFSIFSRKDQQKLKLATSIQIFLAVLDLLGVAIIGIIGAITVYGIQSKETGSRTLKIIEFLNIESLTFQRQVMYLGFFAVIVFITKTISSVVLTRKTLSQEQTEVSQKKVPCRFMFMKLKLVYCIPGNNMFRLHRFELEI